MPARTSAPVASWTRRDTIGVAVVCGVAIAARCLYLLCLRATPFFDHLVVNAAQYEGWARHGYPAGEPFYQSPLYVAWLRLVFVLSTDGTQLLAARVWQMLFGTASATLAFVATRFLLAPLSDRRARLGALVAGLLAGLAGMSLYFDLEILPTALATLLLTGTVTAHVVLRAVQAPRHWHWPLVALVFGLAVITRPNFLLLVPFLAVHAGWVARAHGRRALAAFVLYGLVACVPVGMVAARNTAAGQGFVLLTTSLGDNLLLAHNDAADGFNPFPPADVSRTLEQYAQRGLTMPQRSVAATEVAVQWMQQHPGRTARLWWRKAVAFYNSADIPNNRSIREQERHCAVLRLPPSGWIGLGLLLPLALAGLWCLRRADLRFLFVSIVIGVPVSLLPFLVCARFRTPLLPTLCILAGVAVATAVATVAAGRARRRDGLGIFVALLLGIGIAWPDWVGVQSLEFERLATNRARLYRGLADTERAAGNTQAAEAWIAEVRRTLEQAVRDHPDDATAHVWLADLDREAQRLDAAEAGYRRAVAIDPQMADAWWGLGRLTGRRRQAADARVYYQRALDLRPGDTRLVVEYAELLARSGDPGAARDLLERHLQRSDLSPAARQGLETLLGRLLSGGSR